MQQHLQSEDDSTARLDAAGAPFALTAPQSPALQLRPAVARAISGELCAIADLVCLSTALVCLALWAGTPRIAGNVTALLSMRMSVGHFVVLALCWFVWRTIFTYCGLYTWRHVQSAQGVAGRVVLAAGLSAVVSGQVIASMWHHGHFLRMAVYFWIAASGGALLSRVAICLFHLYVRPHLRRDRNAVIVGGGTRAGKIRDELRVHPEWDYKVLGFVDSAAREVPGSSEPFLGRISDLEEILMRQVVDEVIITLPVKSQYGAIERAISICERVGVQVQYCDDLFDASRLGRCYRERYDNRKLILKMVHDDYRHSIKRALDVVGSLCGLIVCAPLFLLVAILIKCTSEGPVFFGQERYGLGKRTFRIYKFRTMVINAEAAQASLEHMNQNSGPVFKIFNDPRVTKIGAILRRTSIDELPQLFNILRGEMSFVGPRPLNMRDVGRFSEAWLMRRFSVKPGLTCLWQISGRSNVSFDRWIALDLHYIDHWSLQMDLKILAMTVPVVLRGTGAA
jgi:exopolysaccharide biosynthesis polyprenyl glycosylphosphotransferase